MTYLVVALGVRSEPLLVSAGSYNALLRELVAEFTLTDNSANTTTSLLRSLCHYDDSVLMGSWLQETDHKSIEDQVKAVGVMLNSLCAHAHYLALFVVHINCPRVNISFVHIILY